MALALKVLGQTSIGSSTSAQNLLTATGYTSGAVPANKAVLIKNVRVVSRDSSNNRTLTIYYLPGGSDTNKRAVSPKGLTIQPNTMVILDDELVLMAGDKLQVIFDLAVSDNIDFVVSGVERDA